ncbi:nucleotidyltransferase family protein [Foetidibacter luteolus]|uniref:nucleotidyltransferase family protein n=1 Tax=Foetidibacter luteolus TaxID=2608880 RepID=UPI00129ACD66|nr:nucleotidyltransferase family protein [Foetidibacter luteolus]
MLSAIVLAAGLSKRMGADNKLLLAYRQTTVLAATIANIIAAGITDVIVVTGHQASAVSESIAGLPVKIIHNTLFQKGMTTSIQAGIQHTAGQGYMICLGDMLTIEPGEYALLAKAFTAQIMANPNCICLPRYQGEKGNPVIFSTVYKKDILEHKDMEGCKAIVQNNRQHITWVDMPTNHILQDMDYPYDYEQLVSPV